jgi:23S rRNA (uracil1939-C5)-methyltransferase
LLVTYVLGEFARRLPTQGALRVLDLFCGAGLFTLPLLQAGYAVTGAEMSRSAVRAAERSAKLAKLDSSVFCALDLDKPQALRQLVRDAGHPAAVLLDPPRRGLSPRLTGDLVATGPNLLVYVSCDAGTFARDAKKLAERYSLEALRGFDLFPQTHHLELVGTFVRK